MRKDRLRLLKLLKKEAFVKKKVVLSSGKLSNYYIDARAVTLSPEGAYLAAKLILKILKKEGAKAIGGPTLGADPIVGAIACLSFLERAPLKTFIVRNKPKTHGTQKMIEGPILKKGEKTLVIDDVVTTGKSILGAIEVLARQKIRVKKAIALIDRQEGARENLAKKGCELTSVFTKKDFIS